MRLTRRNFVLGAIVVSLALGIIFAVLGVYNSYAMPFGLRYVFWTSTFIVGNVATALVAPWVVDDALKDRSPALQILAVAAIVSLPVTLVLAIWQGGLFPPWPPLDWIVRYGYVIVISLINLTIGYVAMKAFGLIGPEETPGADGASAPETRFLERLPVRYRGAHLYAVSSEDHYVRVHTDRGEELILMRLSDALRELDGADGVQTHRSWWVARDGVRDATRDNGRQSLLLKSGATAPVSRSYAGEVKKHLLGAGA